MQYANININNLRVRHNKKTLRLGELRVRALNVTVVVIVGMWQTADGQVRHQPLHKQNRLHDEHAGEFDVEQTARLGPFCIRSA
jgi:hypothetical protein